MITNVNVCLIIGFMSLTYYTFDENYFLWQKK